MKENIETRTAERTADIVLANTNNYSILVHRLAINLEEKKFTFLKTKRTSTRPQVGRLRRIFLLGIPTEILG